MQKEIYALILGILSEFGLPHTEFTVEHPNDPTHGDFATNIALVVAKSAGKNPRELAQTIVEQLLLKNDPRIKAVAVAGPGFINITLSDQVFREQILSVDEHWGSNKLNSGKKVVVEYTDPNPFKEFHIGHLMSNTVGESISRLIEASGAETMRACYQGDVGLHVAKAVWGIEQLRKQGIVNLSVAVLGQAYVMGAQAFEKDEQTKKEIIEINKYIYNPGTNIRIDVEYKEGRKISLEYFEGIYKRLGTNHGDGKAFNFYFFESMSGVFGKEVVLSHPEIFEQSEGAIVYKGDESKGLHTRVFVNKEGLPTYEAKELGLSKIKYDTYPYDLSVVITGNEVNDYFKVLLDAMGKVFPDLAQKTKHRSHGMLRLPTGKMSSRTGDVITAMSLINEAKVEVMKRIADDRGFTLEDKDEIAEKVAVGAIKYSILRQQIGHDIIFDFNESLSFEGDSGPYLQYAIARINSLLEKAGVVDKEVKEFPELLLLERMLVRFPEIVLRAQEEYAPHHITNYLLAIAREFSAFYSNTPVIGSTYETYYLSLLRAVGKTLENGLTLLGIPVVHRM